MMTLKQENENKMECPKCSSKDIKKYVYGYMGGCKEDEIMGGCMISVEAPSHKCNTCGQDFGKYNN